MVQNGICQPRLRRCIPRKGKDADWWDGDRIIDDKLMPSISTIDGLGDKAADAVVEAAKDGKFLSRDDFRQRTKVSKTVIDKMVELGILSDLPESNQLSLFDL